MPLSWFRASGSWGAILPLVLLINPWIVGALWQIQKILDNELLDMLLRSSARSCYNIDCHSAIWSLYIWHQEPKKCLFHDSSNPPVHPLVIAAHPHEPNQFAVGLSDGSVKVLEPSESEGKWGTPAPADNGIPNGKTPASSAASNPAADQIQR